VAIAIHFGSRLEIGWFVPIDYNLFAEDFLESIKNGVLIVFSGVRYEKNHLEAQK
jgi:hypothetical protein